MSSGPLASFDIVTRQLSRTRQKSESLHTDGRIGRRDLETIYAGLLIQAITGFEDFLDDLFHQICLGKISYAAARGVRPRLSFRSTAVLRQVILGEGREYLDWLPYHQTTKRAEVYLRGGRPFSDLDAADGSSLARAVRVRNAVAHASPYALRTFRDKVVGGAVLLPHERRPVGYLRSAIGAGGQTQFQAILSNLRLIAHRLSP